MKQNRFQVSLPVALVTALILLGLPRSVAHCDALDGPVVRAAETALEAANVNLVLPWVQKEDEPEIEHAFHHTLAVRRLSPEAKELADRFFFETVVRVHRAGEGAPFTGLKSPGTGVTPAITGADNALNTGDVSPLVKALNGQVRDGIHERFTNAAIKKRSATDDVAAGRAYVQAYVAYIHYVEGIHAATTLNREHHTQPGAAPNGKPENKATTEKDSHQH